MYRVTFEKKKWDQCVFTVCTFAIMGDSINIHNYSGGFVYQDFWNLLITFGPDGGKIEFTPAGGGASSASFGGDIAGALGNAVEHHHVLQLHSGGDSGYGYPKVRVSYKGRSFEHTPPTGCDESPQYNPTDDEIARFRAFADSVLQAAHRALPAVPTSTR